MRSNMIKANVPVYVRGFNCPKDLIFKGLLHVLTTYIANLYCFS